MLILVLHQTKRRTSINSDGSIITTWNGAPRGGEGRWRQATGFQCYLCTTSDEGIGRITLQFHTLDSPGGARAALGGESCNGNLVGKQFLSVLPSTPLVAPCLSERIVSLVRAVKRAQICNASGTLAKLLHLCFRKTIFPVPNPL